MKSCLHINESFFKIGSAVSKISSDKQKEIIQNKESVFWFWHVVNNHYKKKGFISKSQTDTLLLFIYVWILFRFWFKTFQELDHLSIFRYIKSYIQNWIKSSHRGSKETDLATLTIVFMILCFCMHLSLYYLKMPMMSLRNCLPAKKEFIANQKCFEELFAVSKE